MSQATVSRLKKNKIRNSEPKATLLWFPFSSFKVSSVRYTSDSINSVAKENKEVNVCPITEFRTNTHSSLEAKRLYSRRSEEYITLDRTLQSEAVATDIPRLPVPAQSAKHGIIRWYIISCSRLIRVYGQYKILESSHLGNSHVESLGFLTA